MLRPLDTRDPNSIATFYKALDGDMAHVRLADQSVDIGRWPIDRTVMWASGRWVDPSLVPTRMTLTYSHAGLVKKGKARLPDYAYALFAQVVSGAFKAIVEAHDPGRHQFLPVRMEWKSKEPVGTDFYWMAPGNRTFAMDVDRTLPPMLDIKTGEGWHNPRPDRPAKRFDITQSMSTWQPVFIRDELGDADLFCDGSLSGCIFVSDRLRSALESAGLTGFSFQGPFDVN